MTFLLLPIILLVFVFVGSACADSIELPAKRSHRARYPCYEEDIQYIVRKLHEKFIKALGPLHKSHQKLPWNQVEIIAGWPPSVYLMEPAYWCKHDIAAMKAALDSIQMRANAEEGTTPPAQELHAQLIVECERLNLMQAKRNIIDWRRIAANTDGLRFTTTHFRKWNAQDRRMAVRLLETLRSIEDGSEMQEYAPVNKHSVKLIMENLSKGWESAKKRRVKPRDAFIKKRRKTEAVIEDFKPVDTVEDDADKETFVEIDKEINDKDVPINQSENENCESEDNEDLFDEILILTSSKYNLDQQAQQQSNQNHIILPSFHRSHSELKLTQYLDVMEQSIEDAQLEEFIVD